VNDWKDGEKEENWKREKETVRTTWKATRNYHAGTTGSEKWRV
jgi:hypothetical protein